MRRDTKNVVSSFFFFMARRIYGLIRRRNLALTPLSRRPSSQHPNLHPCVRAKALRLASRMLPASFFVLARGIMGGTCARVARSPHTLAEPWIFMRHSEGGRMKNHWQISDGLCAAPRSREFIGNASCDCWRRTSAVRRRHPRRCISPSGEECCYFLEVWNRSEDPGDRPEVLCERERSNGTSIRRKKLLAKVITLFIIARNVNSNNLLYISDVFSFRYFHCERFIKAFLLPPGSRGLSFHS